MTVQAIPILPEKFWILEDNGKKCGTLRKESDHEFILSDNQKLKVFHSKESLMKTFGSKFFTDKELPPLNAEENLAYEYPTSCTPFHTMYDVKRKLPIFTKSKKSKSYFCAGYYGIQFNVRWLPSFCPKLITLGKYPYIGPYKTDFELKQAIKHATKHATIEIGEC